MRNMLKKLKRAWSCFVHAWKNDPVKGCDVFKEEGCAHVDGLLCDYPECDILRDHRIRKSRGPDPDACCDNEKRSMSGGCTNCGDPSF